MNYRPTWPATSVAHWDWLAMTPTERRTIPMELFCERAEMSAADLLGLIHAVAYEIGTSAAHAMAACAYPQIMQRSIARALDHDATKEREIHFQHTGFLPSRHGVVVAVNQTNRTVIEREPGPGEPPPLERTARRIVRELPPVE